MAQKIEFKIKRCTSATRLSYTPTESELLHETDTDTVYVGNGTTAGGVSLAASGGESNTASNTGASGVGIFDTKTGVDLAFKKIKAASSKISVTDNGTVDLDINEANFTSFVRNSVVTAKGDILVATAADTITNFPVGADGQVIVSDSSQSSGLNWLKPKSSTYSLDYATTAAYTVDIDNDQAIINAYTGGDCTITFPTSAGFPQNGTGKEFMLYNASPTNTLIVKLPTGEYFSNGMNETKLPNNGDVLRMGGGYPLVGYGWFALQKFHACTSLEYIGQWAANNFSSETAIPLNTTTIEEDDNICNHDDTNVSRMNFVVGGEHHVSFWFKVDSTGGSSYSCDFRLRLNGTTTISGSSGSVANYNNEDSWVSLGPLHISADSGDYIELMVDQNNLTGNINGVVLACNSTV